MAHILKGFEGSFALERSKLDRLIAVLRDTCASPNLELMESFEVLLEDGTLVAVESVEQIYQLHNSGRKLIRDLKVGVTGKPEKPDTLHRNIEVRFSETRRGDGDVSILITDPDSKWAAQAFALIEEQIERCFKKGFMYEFSANRSLRNLVFAFMLVLTTIPVLIFTIIQNDLRDHMWLTHTDLQEIQTELGDSVVMSQEQYLGIFKRQLKNLHLHLGTKSFTFSWPAGFVIAPILIVLALFIYLTRKCYPPVVFVWGDREEWYQRLLNRRALIWNSIFTSALVGIVTGLFLLGLESFVK
jgi:hypothetical protein